MLGNGEVIRERPTSDSRTFTIICQISFSPVRGVYPSLTLNVVVVHSCNFQDSVLLDVSDISLCAVEFCWQGTYCRMQSIVESKIARDTDAGHARFAEYMASETVSHLK